MESGSGGRSLVEGGAPPDGGAEAGSADGLDRAVPPAGMVAASVRGFPSVAGASGLSFCERIWASPAGR